MGPEVETRSGRIRGLEVRGIRTFRGIPYARPPLGTGRFRGPEPPKPWTGTRETTDFGAVPFLLDCDETDLPGVTARQIFRRELVSSVFARAAKDLVPFFEVPESADQASNVA